VSSIETGFWKRGSLETKTDESTEVSFCWHRGCILHSMAKDTELYFAVLPQITVSGNNVGQTEQVLTRLSGREQATAFHIDEIETYILFFNNRQQYLTGGHVKGYSLSQVPKGDGRYYVKVIQHVE
jgi:hypothetical protein